MNTNRQAAVLVGIMFILASATAILGSLSYQPILVDVDYLVNGAEHSTQVRMGALMELILAASAIGTAIGLFPVLRPYGERIALGHLFFRFLEAIVITIGIVSVLSLLTLSQDFVAESAPDAAAFHTSGTLLQAIHNWTFMLGPYLFLGVNTLMYSYLLFKSKLVPRPLAAWGLTGATLVLGAAFLMLLDVAAQGSTLVVLMAMPIATYEMILAGWLIVKGFNASAAESTRPATNDLLSVAG
ncbi:MAG: DUF4386 domain-containing protein [Anaerolineae bacterium]|nr:DUF4386 domain-containing protein [Anaerolineae bacterium]